MKQRRDRGETEEKVKQAPKKDSKNDSEIESILQNSFPWEWLKGLLFEMQDQGWPDAEAIALATGTETGFPRLRTVLAKGVLVGNSLDGSGLSFVDWQELRTMDLGQVSPQGLVFFTNLDSQKSNEMKRNPAVAANFFWAKGLRGSAFDFNKHFVIKPPEKGAEVLADFASTGRQVQIRGSVQRIPRSQDQKYFSTRPRGSQIGAWASHQSQPLASREQFSKEIQKVGERFPAEVPCPPNWGGWVLIPKEWEFWFGRQDRLHDRVRLSRRDDRSDDSNKEWVWELLYP